MGARIRSWAAPLALAVIGAVLVAPTSTEQAGAVEVHEASLDSCIIAGSATGSFPAWNVAGPIDHHAVAPDGTVVFTARGLVWRYAAGSLTVVAGGGARLPTMDGGRIATDDLRFDAPVGLDVAPDGTIWATDGPRLFRIDDDGVTPEWERTDATGSDGPRPVVIHEIHVSAAGVFATAEFAREQGKSNRRIMHVADGSSTVVAGGGYADGRNHPDGVPAHELQLRETEFAVDDSGRIAVDDPAGRGMLIMETDAVFRPTPHVSPLGAPQVFTMAGSGTVIVSDHEGPIEYRDGVWTRLPGPPMYGSIDVTPDGGLVDRGTYFRLRKTSATGVTIELVGHDPQRPLFTNVGRTASDAFFGRIGAIQADGTDLLIAEEAPSLGGALSHSDRIVRLDDDGSITPVAGNGADIGSGGLVLSGPANALTTPIGRVLEIDVAANGDVLFVSRDFGLGRISPDGTLVQLLHAHATSFLQQITGFEELPDGRILFGNGAGELYTRATDGTLMQFSPRRATFEPVVPLHVFGLQRVGDIETARDGTLVIQGDSAIWRVDLGESLARRITTLPSGTGVTALRSSGSGSGIALDAVGNIFIGGHDPDPFGQYTSSDLWRVGPRDSATLLGRMRDYRPELDVGDPDEFGQVGDVAIDPLGNPILTDARSGRIRRLGCTPPTATGVHPLVPARLLDTRDGTGTAVARKPAAGEVVELQVAGRGGVPVGVTAATMNVTVAAPAGSSHLTVWPCDREPSVSNVNFRSGAVVANQVNVALSPAGTVCLRSPVATHLVADVQAWYGPAGDGLRSLRPARLLDSRNAGARIPAGVVTEVPVAGRGGVPVSGASAVALNVTVTQPVGGGWLNVFPCGSPRPLASNVNFSTGQTVPNAALARVGDGGAVCVYSSVATHVIVDVVGSWDTSGERVHFLAPDRSVDTRDRWGAGAPARLRAGRPQVLTPTGALGVPADAKGVLVNATAVNAARSGHVTLYPCDGPAPLASTLNVAPGRVSANAAAAATSADGTICAHSSADVDLVLDVAGYAGGHPG